MAKPRFQLPYLGTEIKFIHSDPSIEAKITSMECLRLASKEMMEMILPETWLLLLARFYSNDAEATAYFSAYSAFYKNYVRIYQNPDKALFLFCGKTSKWIQDKPYVSLFSLFSDLATLQLKI